MVKEPVRCIHEKLSFFYETDPFLQRLINVSKAFNKMPKDQRQNIQMLILRSDYMLDRATNSLKLVEFNTIAAALTSLSQRVYEV